VSNHGERRSGFASTAAGGLRYDLPPLRLFAKAKRLGIWNPDDIDFAQDLRDWQAMTDDERDLILRLTSLFVGGEESVTLDLLPLIMVVAAEGRVDEEIYLSSFLWEEAKHVDFFSTFLQRVAPDAGDLHRYHGTSYRRIFYDALPSAMGALLSDPSPAAQARASATYNMIVEGVLAETGYHGYFEALGRADLMPGLREGVGHLKRDEARHLAYGVFLLSRLVAENAELWPVIEARMEELLPVAMGVIEETLAAYEPIPFGLRPEDFTDFALLQYQQRITRIERARGQSLAEIYAVADDAEAE
jgi:ribonucleoside-diphosphate reductase beta chain